MMALMISLSISLSLLLSLSLLSIIGAAASSQSICDKQCKYECESNDETVVRSEEIAAVAAAATNAMLLLPLFLLADWW